MAVPNSGLANHPVYEVYCNTKYVCTLQKDEIKCRDEIVKKMPELSGTEEWKRRWEDGRWEIWNDVI